MKPKDSKTRDIGPMSLRAALTPGSLDAEKRTVEVTWTTGAAVLRSSHWDGDYYEELSLDPAHVRMGRLENGAPLLAVHNSFNLDAVLGVVESAEIDGVRGTAKVRFSSSEEGEAALQRVAEGVLRNVSVGYRVYKFETTEEEGKIPVLRATDWEPYEISLVPMGADAGAAVRAAGAATNPCEVRLDKRGDDDMKPKKQETKPAAVAQPAEVSAEQRAGQEKEVRKLERERCSELRRMCSALSLADDVAQRWIDGETTVEAARAEAIDLYSDKRKSEPVEQIDNHQRVDVGENLTRKGASEGVRNALMHRSDPTHNDLADAGRLYRGMSLMEMARKFLDANGISTQGLGKRQLAGVALGMDVRAGMHSTSDFPFILADVMGKTLRRSYDEAPQTFQTWARRAVLPDFREVKRLQLGEAPELLEVPEGAEYTHGTIGESREVYSLATYGRTFAITRQTLINDDLDAFARLPMLYGRRARDMESDMVYAHFLANPVMGDGVAMFHANHANVGAGAIGIASVGAGRRAMRRQTGLNGQRINVHANLLLVPTSLETVADQFVSTNLSAAQVNDINVFAGKLGHVAEPRLDDVSEDEWYLAADPNAADTLEYGYLEGEEGVSIESRVGFEVDGIQIKARLDFGVKVIDHRGFYQSSGL